VTTKKTDEQASSTSQGATSDETSTSPAERSTSVESAPGEGEQAATEMARATGEIGKAVAEESLRPMEAPSTDHVSELNNIDFRKMIGGPLQAAVDAQVASSLATVDFINKVGFTGEDGDRKLVMVDFTHKRTERNDAGDPVDIDIELRVPLLAMLPIPSLRIEHVIIDFNVKLNSVESAKTSTALGVGTEVKGGWGPVSMKVSASYQRKTATNIEVKKEYALNVNVRAVQDEMPPGLEKCLNIIAA
jgi:hypothetical protein